MEEMVNMEPIIIAECCQNHNGDREVLKKMIHLAAENGADYVKIQSIRSRELTHRPKFDDGIIDESGQVKVIKRPFKTELERLSKLDLSLDDEAWFVEECWRAGVAPMTTVFTRDVVHEIKDIGFEAVKIASYDCASYPLLRDVKKNWKRVFVSTGATYDHEIEEAATVLSGSDFQFLHCVTIYPTPMADLHLRRISFLRKFCKNVGYSDHSHVEKTHLWASKIALALGASCIERHYTILEKDQTKDGPVSITPHLLKELSLFAKKSRYEMMQEISHNYPEWETSLGESNRDMTENELLNRDYYRGRFASVKDGNPVYNWEE